MKILFVCTGNTCRSVLGQFLLDRMARERGLAGWEARSCGIAAQGGFPVPEEVRRALAQRGVSMTDHVPVRASRELLAWADAALAMTRAHRKYLLDQFPEFQSKIRLFQEFALSEDKDVEDPIGQSDKVYSECRDIIERGLKAILDRHATKAH